MAADDLHSLYGLETFRDTYNGRTAYFEYIGCGLMSIVLEDGEDRTIVEDDDVFDLMGCETYEVIRTSSERVRLILNK